MVAGLTGDTDGHLFMLDTQTGRIEPLTATSNQESSPSVSPDGRRIAFAWGADDFDVVEFGLDGSGPRTLLATSRSEVISRLVAFGRSVRYTTNANVASEIWLRSGQEGSARPLVRLDSGFPSWSELRRPQFSPDGRRIALRIYRLQACHRRFQRRRRRAGGAGLREHGAALVILVPGRKLDCVSAAQPGQR